MNGVSANDVFALSSEPTSNRLKAWLNKLTQPDRPSPRWKELNCASKWKVAVLGAIGIFLTGVGAVAILAGVKALRTVFLTLPAALALLVGGSVVAAVGILFLLAAGYVRRNGAKPDELPYDVTDKETSSVVHQVLIEDGNYAVISEESDCQYLVNSHSISSSDSFDRETATK